MEVKKEISNVYELLENSWSGGYTTVKGILEIDSENNTDYGERLFQHIEEVFSCDEDVPSETTVNDYLWFETQAIYEAIGLNSNGEIPSLVDEAREEGSTWIIVKESLEEMKESGLFEQSLLDFIEEEINNNTLEHHILDFDEVDINQENPVTDEQIEFLNNL